MKNSFLWSHHGFTLVEIVIALAISVIIMGGVLTFLTKLQDDIILSKQSTRVYANLTDFIGTMRNFSKLYATGSVIVSGTGAYNAWIFMRPDMTSGVLIWVVEQKDGNLSKLDPVASKATYGKKVIAYQKLTNSQLTSILAATGTIYNVSFSDDGLFKELPVTDFTITPYNSKSLFEYTFNIEAPFYPEMNGRLRSDINPKVITFPFTLDF